MMRIGLSVAAMACVALALPAGPAFAANNPIPGIDIIVRPEPCGGTGQRPCMPTATGTTGKDGRFNLRLTGAGIYALGSACKRGGPCKAHTLAVTANGAPVKAGPDMTFRITVRLEPVLVSGLATEAGGGARTASGGVTHEDTWDQQR